LGEVRDAVWLQVDGDTTSKHVGGGLGAGNELVESARCPEIVFESATVSADANNRVEILGNLTLHGVTRRERVPAQFAVTGDILRAYGDFSIRQTDYRIKLASVAGGALKLKDELKFTFDIVAGRKTE
jgi:polyisoprenoid-binding protein YceI